MRYTAKAPVDADWQLYEVNKRNRRPCSDEYAESANEEELGHVFASLRLLRAAGCPADHEKGSPDLQKVDKCFPSGQKGKGQYVDVYVLKAKPSRWRLYFYVHDRSKLKIIFLYAASKKTDKRDPEDIKKCCRLIGDLFAGRAQISEIDIPHR